jgi:hypothetical protein
VARRNDSTFAHHGTTKELATEILAKGFTPSKRESDWLGFGIYFWEDSPARALMWAEERYPSQAVCVVDAEVSLEKCLNLGDPEGVAKLRPFYRFYIAALGVELASTLKSTASGNHQLDCRVINYACERLKEDGHPIHVVRSPFIEGEPIFRGDQGVASSRLHEQTHVQLAVREHCAILNIEIDEFDELKEGESAGGR